MDFDKGRWSYYVAGHIRHVTALSTDMWYFVRRILARGSVSHAENDLPTLNSDLLSWRRRESNLTSPVRHTSQENRVTLMIDVPHTDHSHVIGRGGRNIKAVMLDTQCHIHFPDSNRASTAEKSNQDMLPIEFTFALPIRQTSQTSSLRNSPLIRQLEAIHSVEISFRNIYSLFDSHVMVSVKGLSCNSRETKAACQALMQYFYGPNTTIPVSMSINMDPNYQVNFLGHRTPDDLSQLVHQTTDAIITVQDSRYLNDTDSSPGTNQSGSISRLSQSSLTRKSRAKPVKIEIHGTVDSVFLARQLISNLLPVTLVFGVLSEECEWLKHVDIAQLAEQYDVTVDINTKIRHPIRSVVIRTTERNIRSLYSTWQLITGAVHQMASQTIPIVLGISRSSRDTEDLQNSRPGADRVLKDKEPNGSRSVLIR
ncbi:unnamed protein product [Echinostoma caproni]|uniref:KH domain-containing protein n=1 Tax=Echinostoma caproni TaxID=27848 RepID=A0A183AC85_9TREM|nr:unnamed protein product [Echinostoma caproni]